MYRLTTLFLAVCALLSSTSLAAAINSTVPNDISVVCQRYPSMLSGNNTFTPAAITGLSRAISENSYDPKLPTEGVTLRPGYSTRVGWAGSGGFQVCVQNWWFFNTIVVPLKTISEGVAAMNNECCDTDPDAAMLGTSKVPGSGGRNGLCQDAKVTVLDASGRDVVLVAQDYNDLCCGMWGC